MAIISSKKSVVNVNGTIFPATKWSVSVKSSEIDITNFETLGFSDYITGYIDATISVDMFFNDAAIPFVLNTICVGNQPAITLTFNSAIVPTTNFIFPVTVILSADGIAEVRDACRISFTARNKGSFTYPGGITFSGVT